MAFRSIQDRWYVTDPATGKRVPSARRGQGMRYRARYKDTAGKELTRAFPDKEKSKAQRWLDEVTTSVVTGQYVDPKAGHVTFKTYAEQWRAIQVHRPSSRAHVETATAALKLVARVVHRHVKLTASLSSLAPGISLAARSVSWPGCCAFASGW